jgi:hypothetical protein
MNSLKHAALAGIAALAMAAPAAAQNDFEWRGQMAAGQSIEIKGINGSVRAVAATGNEVEVTATRSARRSNPAEVRFEVVPHAGGVTVCALYPSPQGRPANECKPGSGGRMQTNNNDTSVNFTVRVPAGINFVGRTVNGEVDAESLQSNVEGHSVNGSIRLITTGLALATTVNGSINATMGRADWMGEASFRTVNGEITLKLPSAINTELKAQVVNGRIKSDLPVSVTGQVEPRHLQGIIGSGGRQLAISTVNGSITLQK